MCFGHNRSTQRMTQLSLRRVTSVTIIAKYVLVLGCVYNSFQQEG